MWWSGFRTFITGPGVEQSFNIWNMDIVNFERVTVSRHISKAAMSFSLC
jgi:hypothetical protein